MILLKNGGRLVGAGVVVDVGRGCLHRPGVGWSGPRGPCFYYEWGVLAPDF
jgi:hypothetical protein